MGGFLADSSLDCIVDSTTVYVYAQLANGGLVECKGKYKTRKSQTLYVSGGEQSIKQRYFTGDEHDDNAPKLFTPLAAVRFEGVRYVFYVDDENLIQGIRKIKDDWEDCGLSGQVKVQCAAYSQLSAAEATSSKSTFKGICVYYQSGARDAGINLVSFSTKTNRWVNGVPDLTPNPPPPPPRVVDPPLHGTALSAVGYRNGIGFVQTSELPVLFLQWDNFALAHAQGTDVAVISTISARLAPHTSLAVVDDGTALFCFYTSSRNNQIKVFKMSDDRTTSEPQEVGTPTPRSAITAAYVPAQNNIIVFHANLDADANVVKLMAVTMERSLAQSSKEAGWKVARTTVME
ncbi:hypothetical protein V8F06_013346 [Rhypophila decipiens]